MVTTPVFEHLFNIGQGLKSFDTSGNHRHSVLSGNPSWVAGRKGKAIQLDGTDDAFVAPVPECDNDDFTVGFWVQNWLDAGATGAGILALQSSDYVHVAENCLVIYRAVGDGKIKVACYDSSHSLTETLDSGVTASSGFMCVRRSGDTVSFFLNGAFVAEADVSDICAFTWLLVGHTSYGFAVADWIDKIRYWDSALSDEEIEYWYAKDKPRWNDSCVLWLRGDEENGSTVKDYSPQGNNGVLTATLNDGAITSATWVVDAEKGKCLNFDGVNDKCSIPHSSVHNFGTGNFSLCAWVKFTPQSLNTFIIKKDYLTTPRRIFGFSVDVGTIIFGIYDFDTWKNTAGVDCGDGEWHFIVGVREGDNIVLYVDAVAGAPTSGCAAFDLTFAGGVLDFGWMITADKYYQGLLRDVRLYNRALSETEIATLYNRNSEVSYGCVSKWLLNEGEGLVAYDSHNRFADKRGNGLNFNGADEYAVVPYNSVTAKISSLKSFSFCLFIRPYSLNNNPVWNITNNSSTDRLGCGIQNSYAVLEYYNTTDDYGVVRSDEKVESGIRYGVAGSMENKSMKLYINGAEQIGVYGAPIYLGYSSGKFYLGSDNSLAYYSDVLIDDVIFYDRILSAAEIKRVYEADGFLDYIPLRIQDGSLTVSVDSVGVQWDSWANGACRRKHLGLGKNVAYTFTAIEETADVPWIDSAAYILKEKKDSGTPVDLYIKKTDVLAAESTSVVIDSMNVRYSPTMQVRYIDFSVREQ